MEFNQFNNMLADHVIEKIKTIHILLSMLKQTNLKIYNSWRILRKNNDLGEQ